MYKGFIRVATGIPELKVTDCAFNVSKIAELARQAEAQKVQVV